MERQWSQMNCWTCSVIEPPPNALQNYLCHCFLKSCWNTKEKKEWGKRNLAWEITQWKGSMARIEESKWREQDREGSKSCSIATSTAMLFLRQSPILFRTCAFYSVQNKLLIFTLLFFMFFYSILVKEQFLPLKCSASL